MTLSIVNSSAHGFSGSGTTSVTIPSATAGNLLVLIRGTRDVNVDATSPSVPSGFIRIGFYNTSPNQPSRGVVIDAKPAAGGETSITYSFVSSSNYLEITGMGAGGWYLLLQSLGTTFSNDTTPSLASLTKQTVSGLVFAVAWKQPGTPNPGPPTVSGYTTIADTGFAGIGNRHRLTTYQVVSSSQGSAYGGTDFAGATDGSEDGLTVNMELADYVPAAASEFGWSTSAAGNWVGSPVEGLTFDGYGMQFGFATEGVGTVAPIGFGGSRWGFRSDAVGAVPVEGVNDQLFGFRSDGVGIIGLGGIAASRFGWRPSIIAIDYSFYGPATPAWGFSSSGAGIVKEAIVITGGESFGWTAGGFAVVGAHLAETDIKRVYLGPKGIWYQPQPPRTRPR